MGFNIVAQCGNIIRSLSDAPNCTASELKECFDLIALPAVNAINDLISILESSASAGNLGAKNGTVQECIDSLESSVARIGDLSDVGIAGNTVAQKFKNVSENYLRYVVVEKAPDHMEEGVLYIVV